MTRELTDAEGTAWTAVQAFAGLGKDPGKTDAARVEGSPDHVHVVCTPSGGARSVRLSLPEDWEEGMSDGELAAAIQDAANG